MSVKTKRISGRRELRYESFDDLLHDAERLAASDVTTLGNWSLGQIFEHLARTFNMTIDGADFGLPAPVQWVMRMLLKKRFLSKTLPAGFKIPGKATAVLTPKEVSTQAGLAQLREAINRLKHESKRTANPVLGQLTANESDRFQLRHAEMHMSFAVSKTVAANRAAMA